MDKLSTKSRKTLAALKMKTKFTSSSRMPNMKSVSELLNELGINHTFSTTTCRKRTRPRGFAYYTGGGKKTYNGYKLAIPDKGIYIDTTETYYSVNTCGYARDLISLIKNA